MSFLQKRFQLFEFLPTAWTVGRRSREPTTTRPVKRTANHINCHTDLRLILGRVETNIARVKRLTKVVVAWCGVVTVADECSSIITGGGGT